MLTPWGDSTTLRERKLQPARGVASAVVETNQRERLFAAMVAAVADKGYTATTVADLAKISGVSSRTFYDQFGGKEDCFLATLERILGIAGECRDRAEENGSKPGRPTGDIVALSHLIATQPAAAHLAIIESDVVGERAANLVRAASQSFEERLGEALGAGCGKEPLPPQMTAALVGSLREIVAKRLRRGTEAEVPDIVNECWALVSTYQPPPEPLRLSVRPPRTSEESLEASDHADRAIRAFAVLVEEQGYEQTTVEDVVRRAGMSARTFYANFSGREDLMAAAIESAGAQTVAAVLPAFSRHSNWPDGIRAGFGAMLGFLASRPALGRLATLDVYAAGRVAIARRTEGAAPLTALLENNTADWRLSSPLVFEVIAGAIWHTLRETVRTSGPAALPGLAPLLTYMTLSPFIGSDAACKVANGDGGSRPQGKEAAGGEGDEPFPIGTPMNLTIFKAMSLTYERTMSAREISEEVGEDPAIVEEYLSKLSAMRVVAEVAGKDGEVRYRSKKDWYGARIVSTQQSEQLTPEEREELSGFIWDLIEREVDESIEDGVFDQRVERVLARTPMVLDEEGWRELSELHIRTVFAALEIQARAKRRLGESGQTPIHARSMQIAFEYQPGES